MTEDLFQNDPVQEPEEGKHCVKCGIKQPLENFSMANGGNYRRTECHSCTKELQKVRKALKAKHPFPEGDYSCPICDRKLGESVFCLDHSHETNEFRGWLCDYCNRGLGAFSDNLDRLKNAIEYLRNTDGKQEG
jgi:hypothetical protein